MKKEAVWNQIKSILKQNNLNLAPKVSITPGGIGFEIDLVDIQVPTLTPVQGGKSG
jgi:hypothetical protein